MSGGGEGLAFVSLFDRTVVATLPVVLVAPPGPMLEADPRLRRMAGRLWRVAARDLTLDSPDVGSRGALTVTMQRLSPMFEPLAVMLAGRPAAGLPEIDRTCRLAASGQKEPGTGNR